MRPSLILAILAGTAFATPVLAQDNAAPADTATAQTPQTAEAPVPMTPVPGDQKKFDQAAAAYDAKDYPTAYKLFTELADDYDVAAMRNVALMTRDGLGCDKDPKTAEGMMEEAAKRGLPTAQYDLGVMLEDGAAGDPDPAAALPWYEAASQAGHPLAQYRLARLYEKGDVVPQDMKVAVLLYASAAHAGVKDAMERLKAIKGWTEIPREMRPDNGPEPQTAGKSKP
jgi:TPR repeat protein